MANLVDLPQGALAVRIFEPGNFKGNAVLVHGFTGSKEDFDFIGPLLAERGYRVFVADNRGQHESPHSLDLSAYSMKSHAQDVVDIAHKYALSQVHLFGHSFGGAVAQRAFLIEPELFTTLTIFCSGPSAMPVAPYSELMLKELAGKTMQQGWDSFASELYLTHPRAELMKKRWLAHDPKALLVQADELLKFPSVIKDIAATKVPAHVMYGERDDAWPLAMQDQMAGELSAKLTVIKDAGHCPNEDQPVATATAIADFWDLNS